MAARSTAGSDGTVSFFFIMPSDPNVQSVAIAAIGKTSGLAANLSIQENAAALVNPLSGQPGNITINWYDPNLGGLTYLTSVTASSQGKFKTTITAPANLASGSAYLVEVFDPTGAIGQDSFTAQ